MKTINIKGKEYVPVSERLKFLSQNYDYSINTEYQYFPEQKMWVVKARLEIYKNDGIYFYTGLAQEVESANYKDVNHTSALENCETSAIGRCCAMAGIGIDTGIASADEVKKAVNRTSEVTEDAKLYLITLLENTPYDERQKEMLSMRIECLSTKTEYDNALANLQQNQIEDKDRIAMGFPYNQSDIKKTLKNLSK